MMDRAEEQAVGIMCLPKPTLPERDLYFDLLNGMYAEYSAAAQSQFRKGDMEKAKYYQGIADGISISCRHYWEFKNR